MRTGRERFDRLAFARLGVSWAAALIGLTIGTGAAFAGEFRSDF